MMTRDDQLSAVTEIEGDWSRPRGTARGALWVAIPDAAGDPITSFGGTSLADKGAFTEGTTSFTPVGGVLNETIVSDPTEDQVAAFRITAKRGLHVNLRNNAGTEIGTAANPVQVTGGGGGTEYTEDAVAAADPVGGVVILVRNDTPSTTTVTAVGDNIAARADSTGAQYVTILAGAAKIGGDAANGLDVDVTRLPALVAGTANIGDVDVLTVPAPLNLTGGGVEASALRVTIASDSTGVLSVDDNGGSLTVDSAQLPAALVGGRLDVVVGAALPAGTANIGDVDVLSMAAGTTLIGRVYDEPTTGDTIFQGTTSRTVARAIIDAALSGDNTLLAAQGVSNKIRVHALYLVSAGTVVVRFESGAAGTALSGQMNLVANTGFVLPYNPYGWFETAANTLLNLELSAAVSVDGGFQYSVVQ